MTVLEGLKPEKVFYFFEKLCEIPHGSTNMKEISDYLVSFAKERNLKYYQDEAYNVVIYKEASAGYEDAPITILQGHCDMVAEKTLDSNHDFTKDGLKLKVEGDYLTAEGTTLGGDDGIAVAYMLAVLDDDTLKHPALECVITTDEEIGLLGAKALDTSVLKGTHMINMDSEEEGYLWISCAGGLSGTSRIPVEYQEMEGVVTEVLIDGLNGGHSGAEIDKNRANANKLMGLFLYELGQKTAYSIKDLSGGTKDNAITRSCKATLVLGEEDLAEAKITAEKLQKDLRAEYAGSDEGITISVTTGKEETVQALLTEFLGGSYEEQGDYPAWEYRKDSKMRDLMADVYEELFGEKPVVKAIHAGLECGLFYDKIPGLDCVSFGPTMIDIHTTEEKLSIPSTEKMWKYLVRTLEKMNTIR